MVNIQRSLNICFISENVFGSVDVIVTLVSSAKPLFTFCKVNNTFVLDAPVLMIHPHTHTHTNTSSVTSQLCSLFSACQRYAYVIIVLITFLCLLSSGCFKQTHISLKAVGARNLCKHLKITMKCLKPPIQRIVVCCQKLNINRILAK